MVTSSNPTDPIDVLDMLRSMLLIRRFEERTIELRIAGKVHGVIHPYIGQEAVAVGVCSVLTVRDRLVSTHRGHGHCIAKGADLNRMMAELLGRRDGYCKGKGGSMHIAAFEVGMLGANGIVGGGLSIAAGAGLASQLAGDTSVAVGFFGDGATSGGAFHEALSMSALWQLPVVWVCENNGYASETPAEETIPGGDVASYAHGYGMPAIQVDGNDVLAVRQAAGEAVARSRQGGGPTLIEAKTYRVRMHAMRDSIPLEKRPIAELERWKKQDPLGLLVAHLRAEGSLTDQGERTIREAVERELDAAISFAESSPFPDPREALADLYAE